MTTLVLVAALGVCAWILFLSSRLVRLWTLSPAVLMTAYFLLVMLPGMFFAQSSEAVRPALLAYLLWFLGALLAVVGSALKQRESLAATGPLSGNVPVFRVFVLLAIPAVLLTFLMLGRVPLFIGVGSLLGADSGLSMHAARQMNTLEHRSGATFYFGQGYLRQVYAVASPIFLVALYLVTKSRWPKRRSVFVGGMSAFLLFAAMLNGQIWLAVHVGLLILMARYLVFFSSNPGYTGWAVMRKGLFIYLALVCFVFAYRYAQFVLGREFDDFFLSTMARIYSPGAVELFSIFPDSEPFRYGATWINDLSGMLPGSTQSFAYEVHFLVHGGNWGFTLAPGIVASSYVNFGYVGVALVGFAFTYFFNSAFSRLASSGSAMKVALALYLSHGFMLAMPGDLSSYMVCLTTAILIYLAYVLFNSIHRAVRRRVVVNA